MKNEIMEGFFGKKIQTKVEKWTLKIEVLLDIQSNKLKINVNFYTSDILSLCKADPKVENLAKHIRSNLRITI